MRGWLLVMVLALVGCGGPPTAEGTFVGNPSGLTARYERTESASAQGGQLVATEIRVVGCEEPSIDLGAATFVFENGQATTSLPLPDGERCGLRIVATDLTIGFTTSRGAYTITGFDFDLDLAGSFFGDDTAVLVLGGETWLDELSSIVGPGVWVANDDDALRDAFFDGLTDDSAITVIPAE